MAKKLQLEVPCQIELFGCLIAEGRWAGGASRRWITGKSAPGGHPGASSLSGGTGESQHLLAKLGRAQGVVPGNAVTGSPAYRLAPLSWCPAQGCLIGSAWPHGPGRLPNRER